LAEFRNREPGMMTLVIHAIDAESTV
jgi:hypothetical protein